MPKDKEDPPKEIPKKKIGGKKLSTTTKRKKC